MMIEESRRKASLLVKERLMTTRTIGSFASRAKCSVALIRRPSSGRILFKDEGYHTEDRLRPFFCHNYYFSQRIYIE